MIKYLFLFFICSELLAMKQADDIDQETLSSYISIRYNKEINKDLLAAIASPNPRENLSTYYNQQHLSWIDYLSWKNARKTGAYLNLILKQCCKNSSRLEEEKSPHNQWPLISACYDLEIECLKLKYLKSYFKPGHQSKILTIINADITNITAALAQLTPSASPDNPHSLKQLRWNQ